jgi:hypothetical protein
MPYARGKKAFGFSDRSGFRYPLNDMKTEWNGLRVGPDEFEDKHPQLEPPRLRPDAQALRDPRPDPSGTSVNVLLGLPTLEVPQPHIWRIITAVGEPEVTTT